MSCNIVIHILFTWLTLTLYWTMYYPVIMWLVYIYIHGWQHLYSCLEVIVMPPHTSATYIEKEHALPKWKSAEHKMRTCSTNITTLRYHICRPVRWSSIIVPLQSRMSTVNNLKHTFCYGGATVTLRCLTIFGDIYSWLCLRRSMGMVAQFHILDAAHHHDWQCLPLCLVCPPCFHGWSCMYSCLLIHVCMFDSIYSNIW